VSLLAALCCEINYIYNTNFSHLNKHAVTGCATARYTRVKSIIFHDEDCSRVQPVNHQRFLHPPLWVYTHISQHQGTV